MTKLDNQNYLRSQQYKDSSNLNARVSLHERFSTNPQGWFGWVFEHLELPPVSRILELGCGTGQLWHTILQQSGTKLLPEGWDVTLSDFSEGMLSQARETLADTPGFHFQVIDAQSIPFEDAHFDVVIANHMLYHVPDRPRALHEIRRVLKPEGRLYATTVGEMHMQELLSLTDRFDPSGRTEQMKNGGEFSLESGLEQLQAVFRTVYMQRYHDSLHVTEASPLVSYLMSSAGFQADERRVEFAAFIERVFAEKGGVIDITKDSGMFTAY